MARRYDSRTTTFSPEGRLYQVEYAVEAISNAGAVVGVLAKDGVVLVAEKKISSKVTSDVCCCLGGLEAPGDLGPLQFLVPFAPLASVICTSCITLQSLKEGYVTRYIFIHASPCLISLCAGKIALCNVSASSTCDNLHVIFFVLSFRCRWSACGSEHGH
jgi:hypothetical protein